MTWLDNPVLECQDCGDVVRRLTTQENTLVAKNPYNYVVYCQSCKSEAWQRIVDEYWSD